MGGALGSVLRFGLSRWIQGRASNLFFPWGIFTVNVLGCFLMGVCFGLVIERFNPGPVLRSGLFIGILGGFTTFSSFSMDAVSLYFSGAYGTAAIYVLMSVAVCILATALGLYLIRIIG